MRVLVNALPLRFGGGVTYLQRQMESFARVAPHLRFHTLIAPWAEGLDDLPGEVEHVALKSVAQRSLYEQVQLPRRRADVVYSPANFGPLWHRDPTVLTLHNANYYGSGLALPETKPSRPLAKVKAAQWAARRSDAVVAISTSLAHEIRTTLPGLSQLCTIPSGAPSWPKESVPVAGTPDEYVVVIGSRGPHKRIHESVRGWVRSCQLSENPRDLVIVGPVPDLEQAACVGLAGAYAKRIHFIGQIQSREQMRWIYEHALAMVSSSVLEAFPLTPGEAGAVGCPLVLSDIPPHREVTGGRAEFVATGDVEALADVLVAKVYPRKLSREPWTWEHTWDENAGAFVHLFESVVEQRRRRHIPTSG